MKKKPIIPVHCSHSELADPASLQANPQNPKRHSDRKVALYAKIIREGGWRRAIVVSNRSGLIVSGHGAQLAALLLGPAKVPIDRQDFESEEAEKAAMLADNWLAESMSEYNQDLVAEILADLRSAGFDTELAGMLSALEEDQTQAVVKEITVPNPPKMSWVLIGIPTVRFGRINSLVERIAREDGALVETTVNNG